MGAPYSLNHPSVRRLLQYAKTRTAFSVAEVMNHLGMSQQGARQVVWWLEGRGFIEHHSYIYRSQTTGVGTNRTNLWQVTAAGFL